MHKTVINKTIGKLFKPEEVLLSEKFYRFLNRIKIVVFVPQEYAEKVSAAMSKAGAGRIGNYEMCSFRTIGTGTFIPGKNARPFSGIKKALSQVSEIKLEMECDPEAVNKVIDALLKHHPYEETAYEIYDFKKRENREKGMIINLRKEISFSQLLRKMNKRLDFDGKDLSFKFSKIAVVDTDADESILDSAKLTNCECVLSISNSNYKLFKIH